MNKHERTLDPDDWERAKRLGYRIVDDLFDDIKRAKTATFHSIKESDKLALMAPLTKEGEGEEEAYESLFKHAMDSMVAAKTARFWGYVVGGGSHYGVLADMIASEFNWGDSPLFASGVINNQALNYIKEMLGYPMEASGVFVSGGSEANFTGLAVARNARSEIDLKTKGVQGVPRKMTLYMSDQGHDCLDKSVEILGLGNEALRRIPTDDAFKIRVDKLEDAIRIDRENGYHPFCVIGCAGTVNTGAFDDFNKLAGIAEREKMWLHIDGAFGAWVKISQTHKHLTSGMERADSLAVDLHKWMDMPYEIGCTFTRHPTEHVKTFVYGHEAEYLKTAIDALNDLATTNNFCIRLSNQARGVKPYLLLRAYGSKRYCDLVQQNLDQVNYFASEISKQSDMEICAPVESNIVCFRYKPKGLSEEQVEKLNRSILQSLWNISLYMISDTQIKGRYALRVCNVNHRTCKSDFDWLVSEIKKQGEKLFPEIISGK